MIIYNNNNINNKKNNNHIPYSPACTISIKSIKIRLFNMQESKAIYKILI